MDDIQINQSPKKNIKIKIIAIIIALLLIIFGAWFYLGLKIIKAPGQETLQEGEQIELTLKINTGEKSYQYQETLKKDVSVLDLMKEASAKEEFALDIKDSSMGAFVDGIYGVKSNAQTNKFWILWVNGKSSNLGASQYKLSGGDVVEWIYGNM